MKNFIKKSVLLVAFMATTFNLMATSILPATSETQNEGYLITWNHSAADVKFFVVQRSADGVHYFPMAMIHFDDNQTEYAFTDELAQGKNWFYRIVDVKNSGIGNFSNAVYMDATLENYVAK